MHSLFRPRTALAAMSAGLAMLAGTALAQAPAWPAKPIRMIVTFPPGGSTDATVRIIAPRLGERLGTQVVVDNRPGAGGNIGLQALAQSPADGYTLGIGAAGGLAANAAEHLGRGSHVNAVGRLTNNNYEPADGDKVYGYTFTCEEIDFLDSKAESETRRAVHA